MTTNNKRPAIFVDRDGTLIEEVNFLHRVEDLRLFDFTSQAVELFKNAGYLVIVVTNQSGIGRGIFSEADMHGIHGAIQEQLKYPIEAFYFCPHLPSDGCICRKPGRGMIDSALRDFEIDLQSSWVVGDKKIDVETGRNLSIQNALVLTGYGSEHLTQLDFTPNVVANDLWEVASIITKRDLATG